MKNKKKLPVISWYEKISNKKYQVKQNYTKNEKQKKLPVISWFEKISNKKISSEAKLHQKRITKKNSL